MIGQRGNSTLAANPLPFYCPPYLICCLPHQATYTQAPPCTQTHAHPHSDVHYTNLWLQHVLWKRSQQEGACSIVIAFTDGSFRVEMLYCHTGVSCGDNIVGKQSDKTQQNSHIQGNVTAAAIPSLVWCAKTITKRPGILSPRANRVLLLYSIRSMVFRGIDHS